MAEEEINKSGWSCAWQICPPAAEISATGVNVIWSFEYWLLFAAIFLQSLSPLVSMIFRLRSTLDRASFTIIRLPSPTLYSWEDGHPPQTLDVIYKMALKRVLNRVDLLHPSAIRVATSEPVSTHYCDLYEPVGRHIRRRFHWILSTYRTLPGKARRYRLFHIVQQEFQRVSCQVIVTLYLCGWSD